VKIPPSLAITLTSLEEQVQEGEFLSPKIHRLLVYAYGIIVFLELCLVAWSASTPFLLYNSTYLIAHGSGILQACL
jgi:hypothetical protein